MKKSQFKEEISKIKEVLKVLEQKKLLEERSALIDAVASILNKIETEAPASYVARPQRLKGNKLPTKDILNIANRLGLDFDEVYSMSEEQIRVYWSVYALKGLNI